MELVQFGHAYPLFHCCKKPISTTTDRGNNFPGFLLTAIM